MDSKEIRYIVENIQRSSSQQKLNIKTSDHLILNIMDNKPAQFQEFKNNFRLKWESFKKKNQNQVIKKTFTTFFYNHFQEFFNYFLNTFFGFNKDSLNLLSKEKISAKIVFFEYNYLLNQNEEKRLNKISNEYQGEVFYGISLLTGYFFILIRAFGIIIRKIIQEKIFILLDAIIVKNGNENKNVNFMIIIKNSKDEIFHSYYNTALYYFLRQIKGLPEDYYENLLKGRDNLYEIALKEYPTSKDRLIDLLYYFYKKCNLLQSFSPLLDFFNFVGSRVEDSVFSKLDIIKKEFLVNLDYTPEKKNAVIEFFNYLDKTSTLYSTFQANNLPSPKSQLNLFLLYMKYYFGSGLEALEVGDFLFLPDIFKTTLNQYNKNFDDVVGANSIKNIKNILNYLYLLSNIQNINLFFNKIFNKKVSQLNFGFFKTFIKSFNHKFSQKIIQENKNLSDNHQNKPFTFNIIIDHICRILYILIDKIFIRNSPEDASKNFIDPRSRYIGKNIALRVLELFIFQDINYSDDIWPDYVISLNREQLKNEMKKFNIEISNKSFYSYEELIQIMITYNTHSFSNQQFFEEWLIYEIIIPLNNLIQEVKNSVRDPANTDEVTKKLGDYLLSDVKDSQTKKDLKFLCQQLAPFWKNVE